MAPQQKPLSLFGRPGTWSHEFRHWKWTLGGVTAFVCEHVGGWSRVFSTSDFKVTEQRVYRRASSARDSLERAIKRAGQRLTRFARGNHAI